MQALLIVLATWLSINFGLPMIDEQPRIEFASPAKMAEVRYSRLAGLRPDRVAAEAGRSTPPEIGQDVHAIYDDRARTIYLHESWSIARPADVSVLVHELVHHLQNVGGVKYDCPQEREKPAYRAQMKWLEQFDKTLEGEFQIDPLTVLVRTNCFH